jgi:hypothetical protein
LCQGVGAGSIATSRKNGLNIRKFGASRTTSIIELTVKTA